MSDEQLQALMDNHKKKTEVEAIKQATKEVIKRDKLETLEEEYKRKIKECDGYIERLKVTLEMKEKESLISNPDRASGGVRVVKSFAPVDRHTKMAKPFMDKNKGKYFRFINTHADLISLRKSQGFEPVLDKDGDEVRYMDGVLASMPKGRFKEEIIKPSQDLRAHRRAAIKAQFKEKGEELGFETFGKITYDKGELKNGS